MNCCGGNSPRLIKCNYLRGYRIQLALTRLGTRRTYYIEIDIYIYARTLNNLSILNNIKNY